MGDPSNFPCAILMYVLEVTTDSSKPEDLKAIIKIFNF